MNSLTTVVSAIIRSARPVHWIKNLALFAALILTGYLKQKASVRVDFLLVSWAFVSFSLATSATYIFNDIVDSSKDRLHPIKKFRPIAAGKLPKDIAYVISLVLALVALYLASNLNNLFFWTVAIYLILQLFYSLGLKKIAIVDILIIASGFVLRVYAGAFVIDAHLSAWFLLTVISVALFLASGKRRAELGNVGGKTRESLSKYKKELLNSYVTMFGNAAWISWSLYTFFDAPRVSLSAGTFLYLADISKATTISKLLMSTIPVVIFIIMRYEALIFEDKSEAPEKLLLSDRALISAVAIWTAMVLYILYGGFSII